LGEVDPHQQVEDIVDDQPALDIVADDRAEIAEFTAEHADAQLAFALGDRRRTAGPEQQARADGASAEAATRDAAAVRWTDNLGHRALLFSEAPVIFFQ